MLDVNKIEDYNNALGNREIRIREAGNGRYKMTQFEIEGEKTLFESENWEQFNKDYVEKLGQIEIETAHKGCENVLNAYPDFDRKTDSKVVIDLSNYDLEVIKQDGRFYVIDCNDCLVLQNDTLEGVKNDFKVYYGSLLCEQMGL